MFSIALSQQMRNEATVCLELMSGEEIVMHTPEWMLFEHKKEILSFATTWMELEARPCQVK